MGSEGNKVEVKEELLDLANLCDCDYLGQYGDYDEYESTCFALKEHADYW